MAYTVSAEPDGLMVQARPRIQAKGKVPPTLLGHLANTVDKFHVVLADDVGEAITITQPGQAITLPEGRYRFASLSISIADDQGMQ